MASVCGYTDCGFTTDDGEQFNAHMHGHEQETRDKIEAAAEEVRAIEAGNVRALAEIDAQKLGAVHLQNAFNVVAPLVRALRILMEDEKMRAFVVATFAEFWRELNPSGTGAVSVPAQDPSQE